MNNSYVKFMFVVALFFSGSVFANSLDTAQSGTSSDGESGSSSGTSFERKHLKYGSFVIHFSFDAPEFSELENYSDFYGSESTRLNFGVDYYPLRWTYAALGFGLKLSTYSDEGQPLSQASPGAPLEKESGSGIDLGIQQYDLYLSSMVTPFKNQRIGISVWAGYSSLSFDETRSVDNLASSSSDDDSDSSKVYANKGTKDMIGTGVKLMIDITPLEESTVYTMIALLGVDKVFIAPYIARYDSLDDSGADFSNQSYGILFGFEAQK